MRSAVAAFVLALCACCASSAPPPPPKPPPPDPAEETVTALAQALKLDAAQQKRTLELLHELSDRNEKIRAGWSNGASVQPEELTKSQGRFEHDFFAILTAEQRTTLMANRTLLNLQGKMAPH